MIAVLKKSGLMGGFRGGWIAVRRSLFLLLRRGSPTVRHPAMRGCVRRHPVSWGSE
jgi:hypothetical protein